MRSVRYLWARLRSWWYWRRFDSPGRSLAEHKAFADARIGHGHRPLWEAPR